MTDVFIISRKVLSGSSQRREKFTKSLCYSGLEDAKWCVRGFWFPCLLDGTPEAVCVLIGRMLDVHRRGFPLSMVCVSLSSKNSFGTNFKRTGTTSFRHCISHRTVQQREQVPVLSSRKGQESWRHKKDWEVIHHPSQSPDRYE